MDKFSLFFVKGRGFVCYRVVGGSMDIRGFFRELPSDRIWDWI
jgi:hypothetical protein